MAFLIRTFESVFYPVGFIWICLTLTAIVLWRRKVQRPAAACGLLSLFLFLIGATPLPEFLIARLERPYAGGNITNTAPADVIIVLGGNLNPSPNDSFQISLNTSGDRVITGVELLRLKKAPALILGGGPANIGADKVSEGQRVENWLKTWNVAPAQIIGLPACANTREEALRSRGVMSQHHWTNAILVTSAYHMPRALATFQKAGISARPVACDFEGLYSAEGRVAGFRVVPIIEHLKVFTFYLHEIIGSLYYSARGWI